MEVHLSEFVTSSASVDQMPETMKPEFALLGRSNVGKSSLLNLICGRKNLARISVKPGKTQTINHFIIDSAWYLADLPGYGFAKVSKTQREMWRKLMRGYIDNRKNLVAILLLIDARIPIMASDMEIIKELGRKEVPFCLVFTKSDGLKATELSQKKKLYSEELLKTWEELPPMIFTSARKKTGRQELLKYIEEGMRTYLS